MYDDKWWSELRQGGALLSPTVLQERLPEVPEVEEKRYERLRDSYTRYISIRSKKEDEDRGNLNAWLNEVLEVFLGIPREWWLRGSAIPPTLRVQGIGRERIHPDRALILGADVSRPLLLLRTDDRGRIGSGKGRNEYSKLIELIRGAKVDLGMITNGEQFRLVHAGLEHDCWVEWEASRWFEDSLGRKQLEGLLALCGKEMFAGPSGSFPLREWVKESRSKQGELSAVLGEQTRKAVETLLDALDSSVRAQPELRAYFDDLGLNEEHRLEAMYQGAIRIVMRLVVVFYAESRGLLERDREAYYSSYGAEGLFRQLSSAVRACGEGSLQDQEHSWPRLLALFRMIHEGCSDPDLQITRYGGELFERGDPRSTDPILRAVALFEDDRVKVNDAVVHRVLKLLRIGKMRAKSGRTFQTVSGPVDFSDLRTEYIGMMYEGLLDYRLREVTAEEEAVVFLSLGDQPALPLSLLKRMGDAQLKDLLKGIGKPEKGSDSEDEEDSEEGEGELSGEEIIEEANREEEMREAEDPVLIWARHAVTVLGKVKRGTGRNFNEFEYKRKLDEEANKLIADSKKQGQMYLVRSSGTRKGTGTFYTRPQLAVPTVKRTLEPLLYDLTDEGALPKTPEEILAVKVCDPAMGSGSFLVATLNEITEALYRSLWEHGRLKQGDGETTIVLPAGERSKAGLKEDLVKFRSDEEHFEAATKARLKRYVVENCIYGVDINPLAVELAKLSLWVETLDRELPFGFLDHKLKCGNSLVGCWLDRFQEYPLLAWIREGGDLKHSGVHFEDGGWTKAIKDTLNKRVKPELLAIINGQMSLSDYAYEDDRQIESLKGRALRLAEEMRSKDLFGDGFQEREEFYRNKVMNDEGLRSLREAFDLWCSVWFWPGDTLDECPTPSMFYKPSESLLSKCREVAQGMQFFHWELEFPDVFFGPGGFDAVVGNPPWEISKPISKEFFTRYDPIYRTYGKQEALSKQKELFNKDEGIERAWLSYSSKFKAMSNWVGNSAYPYGDDKDEALGGTKLSLSGKGAGNPHERWRDKRQRKGVDSRGHPFRHQGSADLNTYKMFLETALELNRDGGRMGLIVPSGIYTDNGTKALRELFIDRCQWEWMFCFENRKKIFNIDSRFKFGPVIVQKGGRTERIRTAFMRHDLSDWEDPERFAIDYGREQIDKFSPKSMSILEIRSKRDLEILTKIYSNSVLLGDQGPEGWGIKYATEFHMTNDSHLFPPRSWWEDKGYKPDQYGRWLPPEGEMPELIYKGKKIGPPGDVGLPLYQGIMIHQFCKFAKHWISGTGANAKWVELDYSNPIVGPQYVITEDACNKKNSYQRGLKIVFRTIARTTDERTFISSYLFNYPCGHSLFNLHLKRGIFDTVLLTGILNSFIFDWQLRIRIGGTNLSLYYMDETSTPNIQDLLMKRIIYLVIRLNSISESDAFLWIGLKEIIPQIKLCNWKAQWAVTEYERVKIRSELDALIAFSYGISFDELAWILRIDNCDPKGFWRVDKDKPIELRHTTLTLAAYNDLTKLGLTKYVNLNDGNGWELPEKIKFSIREDGTLDFSDANSIEYEVASKLGPRFLPWQLEGTPEESWQECNTHARNNLGEEGFKKFMKYLEDGKYDPSTSDDSASQNEDVLKVLEKARSSYQEVLDGKRKQKGLFDFGGDGK